METFLNKMIDLGFHWMRVDYRTVKKAVGLCIKILHTKAIFDSIYAEQRAFIFDFLRNSNAIKINKVIIFLPKLIFNKKFFDLLKERVTL